MTLEQMCCSLEPSIKLKELGVPQNSVFYWTDEDIILMPGYDKWKITNAKGLYQPAKYISAFTSGELGEMLPYAIKKQDILYFLEQSKRTSGHNYDSPIAFIEVAYVSISAGAIALPIQEKTEADARAAMLIYLLKNKLINL